MNSGLGEFAEREMILYLFLISCYMLIENAGLKVQGDLIRAFESHLLPFTSNSLYLDLCEVDSSQ